MKAAFYKGTRPGIAAIYSIGVRLWTKSPYSHCELIFSDGVAASSSATDGGVRFAQIEFDPEHWDFIELPSEYEVVARKWFTEHQGQKYDIFGNVHFLVGPISDERTKWFCSEAVGASLGITDPWRYSPGDLYVALKFLTDHLNKYTA